jgi:hypothetical protein
MWIQGVGVTWSHLPFGLLLEFPPQSKGRPSQSTPSWGKEKEEEKKKREKEEELKEKGMDCERE